MGWKFFGKSSDDNDDPVAKLREVWETIDETTGLTDEEKIKLKRAAREDFNKEAGSKSEQAKDSAMDDYRIARVDKQVNVNRNLRHQGFTKQRDGTWEDKDGNRKDEYGNDINPGGMY